MPDLPDPAAGRPLVLGVDGGGTGARALVAARDGRRVSTGTAGGANPVSRGIEAAVREIGRCIAAALAGIDPAEVGEVVLALAGATTYTVARDLGLGEMLRAAGLAGPWRLVSDIEAAFAAGTPRPAGAVLIAGTGAVGGAIEDNALISQVDGTGYLLGDDGSGFWFGREAVRAALAHLDRRGPATSLTARCLAAYGLTGREPAGANAVSVGRRLVERVYAAAPIDLAERAPLLLEAAGAGDAVALAIARRGADLLVATATAAADAGVHHLAGLPAHPPVEWPPSADDTPAAAAKSDESTEGTGSRSERGTGEPGPVVLAGGLLTRAGPVRDRVVAGIRAGLGVDALTAYDGAAGAAWLALVDADRADVVHARLVR
ncbi:MAG: N-acetylglucosamine kinase [Mycobacteriales bacterium]